MKVCTLGLRLNNGEQRVLEKEEASTLVIGSAGHGVPPLSVKHEGVESVTKACILATGTSLLQ